MPKINLKNTNRDPLVSFIKRRKPSFSVKDRSVENGQRKEKILIRTNNQEDRDELLAIANGYGTQLYHDTTFEEYMSLKNVFIFSSNEYENFTTNTEELELPNYYLENTNQQNESNKNLKALNSNIITKKFLNSLSKNQPQLNSRTPAQVLKFRNILFGTNYSNSRTKNNLDQFPYYNRIDVRSRNSNGSLGALIKNLSFREEMLAGLLGDSETVGVSFNLNNNPGTVEIRDIFVTLGNKSLDLDTEDKLVLGDQKQNSNFMINNFKKNIIQNSLMNKISGDMLSFAKIINGVEAKREVLVYKVDKFIDTDSFPIQTFWLFDEEDYYDYQIKRDKEYRYELSCYCFIYGVETRILESKEDRDNVVITMTSSPSYKYAVLKIDEDSVKVSPKIPMPPFVNFYNENNEENSIKIYLSLKNGSAKQSFQPVSESDIQAVTGVESEDDMYEFDYEVQDGKFEVYRLTEMPESYRDFENAKLLDVRNKISTTDVVFKESVKPNKKYYYMFRSVNVIGVPSNPSPVFEVELIKMASVSKIVAKVFSMTKEQSFPDKTFKNLLQIKPAFQQDVFDDQSEIAQGLSTFKKNINDLTLGTADDKIWGKKFKIRVKSKDSGKIIDLNVKFNLIKDNIK